MKKILLLLIILCFTMPQFAHAGAWTVPQYSVWAQETLKANWARTEFGPGPDRDRRRYDRDARSWGWGMIPEINVGITDWLNGLFQMEYKEQKYKEYARPTLPGWGPYSASNHGVTSITPGIKIRLLEKPVVLAVQAKYEIYNKYDDLPLEDVAEQPGLSDRTDAFELRGIISRKWDTQIPFFLSAESGYRWNVRNLQNQVPFFIEGGFWPLKWLLIKTEIDGYWSVDGKRPLEKAYAIWRAGPEIQLLDLWDELRGKKVTEREVTASVTKKGRSLNVGVQYGNTFWGQSTAASQEVILKISGQY